MKWKGWEVRLERWIGVKSQSSWCTGLRNLASILKVTGTLAQKRQQPYSCFRLISLPQVGQASVKWAREDQERPKAKRLLY